MNIFAKYWVNHIVEDFNKLICLSNEYSKPLYIWKNFTDKYNCGIPESGEIMKRLVKRGMIKKEHLSLFASKFCNLDFCAYLRAMQLDDQAIRFVCDKSLFKLDILYCKGIRLNEVVHCLEKYSRITLETLNIPQIEFDLKSLASLNAFTNLKWLNLRNSYLDDEGLKVLSNALTNIMYLDISSTYVKEIESLQKFEKTLTELNLRNLELNEYFIATLLVLRNLKVLDISQHVSKYADRPQGIENFITNSLPNLMEIDLSGNRLYLTFDELKDFIKNHQHLRFVGLVRWMDTDNIIPEIALNNSDIMFAGEGSREMRFNILLRYCNRFAPDSIFTYLYGPSQSIMKEEYVCAMEALNLAIDTYRYKKSFVPKCISIMNLIISDFKILPDDVVSKVEETILDYLAYCKDNIDASLEAFTLFRKMESYSLLKMDKRWWFNSLFELMKDSKRERYYGKVLYENSCLVFKEMSQEERNEVGSQRNILRFLLEHITVSFLGAKNIEGLKIRTNDHYFVWPHIPNLVDLYVSHLLGKLLKGSSDARTLFFNDSGLESLLIIFKGIEMWRWSSRNYKKIFLAEILNIFLLYAREPNLKDIFLQDPYLRIFGDLMKWPKFNISHYTCDIIYHLLSTPKNAWNVFKYTKSKMIKSLGSIKKPSLVKSTDELIGHSECRLDIIYCIFRNIIKGISQSNSFVDKLDDFPKLKRCILYFAFLSDDAVASTSSKSFKYPFNVPANAELPASWQYLRTEIENVLAPLDEADNRNANFDVEVEDDEDCDNMPRHLRVEAIRQIAKEILQKASEYEPNMMSQE